MTDLSSIIKSCSS